MASNVSITNSGMLFVRTRYYDDVKEVVVLQGAKVAKRFYAERMEGRWIPNTRYNRKGKIFLNCSVCHYGDCGDVMCFTSSIPKFCPNCGAKMSFEKGGGS